ncbi:hypothetical protein EBB07_16330 [Paenibacillaceae bacterium]|nr:hypothetical protein EBB07_16330 [Paenibacillaceae bacterium]
MNEHPYSIGIRITFVTVAWLFTASVVLQVLFAGLAFFVDSNNWAHHVSFARYFAFLPLVLAVLGWIGRMPKHVIWRCIGLLGIVVGMFLTAILSARIGVFSALHPVLALLLFNGSITLIRSARKPSNTLQRNRRNN